MTFLNRHGEVLGTYFGHLTGALFAIGSCLRKSRIFHPQGLVYEGVVKSSVLPPHVLVRFSSSIWKGKEWPDILGVALRFGAEKDWQFSEQNQYQDILLVSTDHIWKLPFGPLVTNHKNFLDNRYYAITTFKLDDEFTKFRLLCEPGVPKKNRAETLEVSVREKRAKLLLQKSSNSGWSTMAEIDLNKELIIDQEKLNFSPFHTAFGIFPSGFVNFLRLHSYELSQRARAKARKEKKSFLKLHRYSRSTHLN